ncbi:MAG: DNA polymerase III subunit delta' [Proteobacteria bacterium]|nr:DNA polymerase III subunit delta' [Pseudomonadota bacterium]
MLTPRENLKLIGYEKERDAFLNAFHSDRFSHAWIIAGAFGSGKATFAFHMARYILSGRQDKNTIFLENDPLHRRIVVQSHADLWVLGDEETREIGVESVRNLNNFLTQTAGEGGWRVIIVDGAEALNRNAANALLKRLEEPPPKTVFFLITSSPRRLLATIRSRCQLLTLASLKDENVRNILQSQGVSSSFKEGTPGQIMRCMEGKGPQIQEELEKILEGAPTASFIRSYGGDETSYELIETLLRNFLHTHLLAKINEKASFFKDASIEQALAIYEKIEQLFDQCHNAQLDKRTTLLCALASLENRKI